ncbi:hypothetical protein [Rhodopseudomonas sp.]|uniref:hypothetical protein n=1 Tax=Rhodopseudomonas sp. TaxID=1078 RepID=UPI002ED7E14A
MTTQLEPDRRDAPRISRLAEYRNGRGDSQKFPRLCRGEPLDAAMRRRSRGACPARSQTIDHKCRKFRRICSISAAIRDFVLNVP